MMVVAGGTIPFVVGQDHQRALGERAGKGGQQIYVIGNAPVGKIAGALLVSGDGDMTANQYVSCLL